MRDRVGRWLVKFTLFYVLLIYTIQRGLGVWTLGCQNLPSFRIDLTEETQAVGNEEMTDTCTGKLGSGGPCPLTEMHQQPGNSVCLLYRAE